MIDTNKALIKDILNEQFIPDHVFVYVATGAIRCFDGSKHYLFKTGDYFLARKNRLARYVIEGDKFNPIIVCMDEAFLRRFQIKHAIEPSQKHVSTDTFISIVRNKLIPKYIDSLQPYYDQKDKIDQLFEDVKNEELLLILLRNQPELSRVFFNFNKPEKIDLEEFMNRNFRFNVRIEKFAYLTGRSLSAFKRDFNSVFNDAPNQWLIKRRLDEAHFLIGEEHKKPSEIYLDLGFQDLSHFSFAFKRQFGLTPTELSSGK